MYYSNVSCAEGIKEYLIANQAQLKEDIQMFIVKKEEWLRTLNPVYKDDVEGQFEARIKQHIAFVCSRALALPTEYVIVELENIDLEKYLNV